MAESRIIAFAGDGVTTVENARAVLNDWLPETVEVEGFIVPENIKARSQKGLAAVVTYLNEDWGDDTSDEDPYESVPPEDLVVVSLLARENDDALPFLIVILGEASPDDFTASLIADARESGIPVLDLAAGLDEYTADEDTAETPATAPEPEPARGARRRRGTAAEEPAVAPETPARASRTRGKPRTTEEVNEIGTKALDSLAEKRAEAAAAEDKPPFDGPYKGELITSEPTFTITDIRSVIREELSALLTGLGGTLVNMGKGVTPVGVEYREGGASAPGQQIQKCLDHITATYGGATEGADGPTAAYIKAEDGKLRKRGRGKPRAGEEEVWLTASQAEAKGLPF
jgi:hypothetical protein